MRLDAAIAKVGKIQGMQILVTGAGGFVGKALCVALRNSGHDVHELRSEAGDVASSITWSQVPATEHVFHLAGRTFVPDSWDDPARFHDTNVLGTARALEYCRKMGCSLTFLSAYLYGVPERLPINEDCPLRPNNPYALSKRLAEELCEFHAAYYGVTTTILRPFNLFGPGQKEHFLIPHVIRQLTEQSEVRVKDLEPRRDYLYLTDFVDLLTKTLKAPDGYNVFNVGAGSSLSVREIIDIIQTVAGTDLPVISTGEIRRNEIDDVRADISRVCARFGWSPSISFERGVTHLLHGARG